MKIDISRTINKVEEIFFKNTISGFITRKEMLITNLQSTTESKDKMYDWSSLNFVISCSFFIRHLFPRKNQSLLCWWNSFFFFNPLLDYLDFSVGFNINFNFFTSEGLYFDCILSKFLKMSNAFRMLPNWELNWYFG